jgi:hypothetical protein
MKKSNLKIDIYKGEINTFITVRHTPTDISISKCTKRDSGLVLKEMLGELKKKIEQHFKDRK